MQPQKMTPAERRRLMEVLMRAIVGGAAKPKLPQQLFGLGQVSGIGTSANDLPGGSSGRFSRVDQFNVPPAFKEPEEAIVDWALGGVDPRYRK